MNEREKELERRIAELEAQNASLNETKALLAARTSLAWMGMVSSTWRHNIEGKAINIVNIVALIQKKLKTEFDQEDISSKLELIERLAHEIIERPITPPLTSEEGLETFDLNELLRARVKQLHENAFKPDVTIKLKLDANSPAYVFASPEWIRRGLDLLIDNSLRAMDTAPTKRLTIISSTTGDQIKIIIQDTGSGISPDLNSKLFTEPIAKRRGENGLGMGLLMAQTIFQTYRGNIKLVESDSSGTIFSINLPKQTSAS
jgi:C4-dicarboxylate-specific signal transduction histidine kinase